MNTASFSVEFTVPQPPEQVYAAVTRVRDWWSEQIVGDSGAVGDEFVFSDEGIRHARFRVTEAVPGRRMVWQVVDSYLNFVDDHDEWTGTRVIFDLAHGADGTTLRLAHEGLLPAVECYDACSLGWTACLHSIKELVVTGRSQTGPRS